MTSTIETGHAKNVANFQDLISFAIGYGTTYNPSKNALQIPQLNALLATSQTSLNDVITKNTDYNNKVNERIIAFSNLKALSTRLINALEATNASPEKIKDAKGFNRKIQGKRTTTTTSATIDTHTTVPATISASQMSYDQQIQHFAGLISILQSEPSYTPNEADLKITALTAKQKDLMDKNKDTTAAYANISNSRIARNKSLYATDTGLVDTATEVKKYLKSIFGAASPQYAQVNGIKFKKARK